ncbi:MAG: c-type cytochrome [Bacteroidales bacterium]
MKSRFFTLSIVAGIFTLGIMASCGGGQSTDSASTTDTTKKAATAAAPDMVLGESIYTTKCKVCHQPDGKGIKGAFPPLAASDYLLADKVRAVSQALNGSNMEIVVNGEKYKALMPQQVNTKEEAVAVINYVLNTFGNNGGTVTLDEVKDVVIDARVAAPAK